MKKVLGFLLAGLGLFATLYIIFFAFNGKYGMNQFIHDFFRFKGNMGFLAYSIGSIAVMILGISMMLSKKKQG